MNRLIVELSSQQGSLALYSDVQCLEDLTWQEQRFNNQRIFEEIHAALGRHDMQPADLDRLVAGRGPGNFSGLRISMAALKGLAMPHGVELCGISSGYALAWRTLKDEGVDRVTVSGDARRGTVWTGTFAMVNDHLKVETDWHLVPLTAFESSLPTEAVHVSPEWTRLGPHLSRTSRWITEDRFPRAVDLDRVYHQRNQFDASEPFEPIYMHPPVDPPPATNS